MFHIFRPLCITVFKKQTKKRNITAAAQEHPTHLKMFVKMQAKNNNKKNSINKIQKNKTLI